MKKEETVLSEVDYHLAVLGEECGEVQQVVGKSLRFGINDFPPTDNTYDNFQLIRKEVHDIVAAFELVCESMDESSELDPVMIQAKKDRVNHYKQYSRDVGKLI